MSLDFEQLRSEYAALWRCMQIRPERVAQVDAIARRLLATKQRYLGVASRIGAPWFLIAALHERESGANFNAHLHEGSPLTARTLHVPRGRPISPDPPYSWETSAIDALTTPPYELNKVAQWSVERVCYEAERYNGFGYRRRGIRSPYVWSFSNNYAAGKYVRDGQFSVGAIDGQCGVMPIIKRLSELDRTICLDGTAIVSDAAGQVLPPTSAPAPQQNDILLRLMIEALSPKAPPTSQQGQQPPILSPIDRVIGGEALVGLKTAIAVIAYALVAILQANGAISGDSSATQIVKILIVAVGSLGVLSKFERLVQAAALIAQKKTNSVTGAN
jgi:lysozyme family protein